MKAEASTEVGLTKAVATIYLFFGAAAIAAVLSGAEIADVKLDWRTDIWLPATIVLAAIGTLRRTKWGRWLSYVISGFIILGVPIGTFLGGYMLWHLTKYRAAFNKWY